MSDAEQWQKVQLLVDNGFLFQSIYDQKHGGLNVKYPTTLRETPAWIAKWKRESVPASSAE
jgi:hypothetical protein